MKERAISRKTKKILDKVDLITLRDERSYKTLSEIGIENKNVKVTADPALDLDIADEKLGKAILKMRVFRVIKNCSECR